MDKQTKEVTIKLHYIKSFSDTHGNYFGGVIEPKYLNELRFDVNNDYDYDIKTEAFVENGLHSVEISGSNRALKEFGKFLINIALFKTSDDNYHEHLDLIQDKNNNPSVNLIVSKKAPASNDKRQ